MTDIKACSTKEIKKNFSNTNPRIQKLLNDLIKEDINFCTYKIDNIVNQFNGNITYIRDGISFEYNGQVISVQVSYENDNKLSFFIYGTSSAYYMGDRITLHNIKKAIDSKPRQCNLTLETVVNRLASSLEYKRINTIFIKR